MRRLGVALLLVSCVNASEVRDEFCMARPYFCDGGYDVVDDAGDTNDDDAGAGSDAGDGGDAPDAGDAGSSSDAGDGGA